MVILFSFIFLLFLASTVITFINEDFQTESSVFDVEGNVIQTREAAENVKTTNAFKVMLNVLKIGLWDVGDSLNLPFWLDLLFSVIGTTIIFIIARNLWIGGGG